MKPARGPQTMFLSTLCYTLFATQPLLCTLCYALFAVHSLLCHLCYALFAMHSLPCNICCESNMVQPHVASTTARAATQSHVA